MSPLSVCIDNLEQMALKRPAKVSHRWLEMLPVMSVFYMFKRLRFEVVSLVNIGEHTYSIGLHEIFGSFHQFHQRCTFAASCRERGLWGEAICYLGHSLIRSISIDFFQNYLSSMTWVKAVRECLHENKRAPSLENSHDQSSNAVGKSTNTNHFLLFSMHTHCSHTFY